MAFDLVEPCLKCNFYLPDIIQHGEGRNSRFIIESEENRFYRRFGYNGREIRGRIAEIPPGANVYAWLEGSIHDLHRQLCTRGEPTDFIGITINSERFNQGPLWLSFRPIQNFHADDLWELLFNAVQSANDFNVEDSLSISCGIVPTVRGRGRVRLTEDAVRKRSILTILNEDNLCLPRALAAGYAYVVRGQIRTGQLHQYWNLIRRSEGPTQRNAATELTHLARVEVPEQGCGIDEIHAFQVFFATRATAIIVYSFRHFGRGSPPLYDGTRFVMESNGSIQHTLRIMYYDSNNHYEPILNLVGASGSGGYCIPCNKSYWRVSDHRCSNKCRRCMRTPPCDISTRLVHCNTCRRDFFGLECYQHHVERGSFNKLNSVCDKIKICETCLRVVSDRKHKCGLFYCQTCKAELPNEHRCYMQPIRERTTTPNVLYIFYDFETHQITPILGDEEKKIHVPNLAVVQQVCTFCLEVEFTGMRCEHCGVREYIFDIDPVKQLVELVLAPREKFNRIVCIAHNSQGFDAQFIFKYLVEKHDERHVPSVIMNGSKIILMEYLNAKFLDSLNYFHMALAALPKAYGLQEKNKGVFPHLFNEPCNFSYVGPLPPVEKYSPERMYTEERRKFLQWYNETLTSGYVFNFREEIIKYCRQDVEILRLACLAFRKSFMKFGVDPFDNCTTIASSCMHVYRKKFLQKNQIGIIPAGGYRMGENQSVKAVKWLFWMEKKVLNRPMEHAGRTRERRLFGNIPVDGYCPPSQEENHNGLVLQFHGCFWHGCPRCFRINRDIQLGSGETMDSRYERTRATSFKITQNGFDLIEKWECDFDAELAENEEMKQFFRGYESILKQDSLNPRDAFFGGRTGNTVKVYDTRPDEKIFYEDVISLYPEQCMVGEFPEDHPKIYVGEEECRELVGVNNNISNVKGLILCDVLPPRNLYHPVLPVKMHGKLIFPLCRTCCELMLQQDCPHDDPKERILHGTWVSLELQTAVEMGYVVTAVYEIWEYRMTRYDPRTGKGGLFAGYIKEFYKQKVMASGYPPEYITEEDKERYVRELREEENIVLNKEDIQYNPGLRSVAKLCLNSLWGKFGQRENLTQTEVVTKPERLMELLTSAEVDVNGILPVNDDTLYVNWCIRTEAFSPSSKTNTVVAAFVTAQARLKLFRYLHALGPRALYYDTDSVFYVTRDGEEKLPTGKKLGDLSDELAGRGVGTYIVSFLSGGAKFYAFKCRKPDGSEEYVCKVKGIRLNHTNSQQVNYESIRQLITTENSEIVLSNTAIRRTCFHDVITLQETKTCKPVYTKRRFVSHVRSHPYGYRNATEVEE